MFLHWFLLSQWENVRRSFTFAAGELASQMAGSKLINNSFRSKNLRLAHLSPLFICRLFVLLSWDTCEARGSVRRRLPLHSHARKDADQSRATRLMLPSGREIPQIVYIWKMHCIINTWALNQTRCLHHDLQYSDGKCKDKRKTVKSPFNRWVHPSCFFLSLSPRPIFFLCL